ncbi:P2 family phage major capsid protein [Escherichia coli]|uniref:P2 family phage major capsid protein n=2 Tax=Escherichia coli TaxID=562 RepID=UPI000B7F8AB2|nr:P2 family phage major capsid protein [Escherichia coli]
MKKNTRFAFNAYLQQLARLNGVAVEELSSKFTVEPSVQQTLEDQIQQSAAFLTLINVTPVTEQSGHRIEAPTQIIIQTQPGQSAQDIAREVARQLDERERRLKAKARSNYSDQGGYDA